LEPPHIKTEADILNEPYPKGELTQENIHSDGLNEDRILDFLNQRSFYIVE
jgi:hypothetical protein